jgi:hypothetical protein
MDLLEKLKAGKSVIKTVMLSDVELGMRLLSENDYFEAGMAVVDFFKGRQIHDVNMANAELFESEKSNQLLLRALVKPGSGDPVAESPLALRKVLSREDKSWLIEQYLAFEKEYSPGERTMGDVEFADLLDDVKKNPETARLSDLSFDMLRKLIVALASQPSS